MQKKRGGIPRRQLADMYMRTRDPAERKRLAAQLRALKAESKKPERPWPVIKSRWDMDRNYIRRALAAGWTPRDCDWCGGLFPARDEKHRFCSEICSQEGTKTARRRAVTHGH